MVAGHSAWLPIGGIVVSYIVIKLLLLLFPSLVLIWKKKEKEEDKKIPKNDSNTNEDVTIIPIQVENDVKSNSAIMKERYNQEFKIYDCLYDELYEKCNPKNYTNPYDEQKFGLMVKRVPKILVII